MISTYIICINIDNVTGKCFALDYTIYLWVDHTPHSFKEAPNLKIKNINEELWMNEDLLDACTNYAMKSDILRLEIVYIYGGIYVDVDATAHRSFGPVFSKSFLSFRPANWSMSHEVFSQIQNDGNKIGSAGMDNGIFGFSVQSHFLKYALDALRENFPMQSATLFKTGPYFLKEAFLQYPHAYKIALISWDFIGNDSEFAILVDKPSDSDWVDGQDVRKDNKQ